MVVKAIKVSIGKGEKQVKVDAEKRVFNWEDILSYGNTTEHVEEIVKLVNYAEDLKVRAAKRSEFTDVGSKNKNRDKAVDFIMKQIAAGDFSFQQQFADAMKKGTKEKNAYLDELYESTEELHEA